MMVVVVAGCEIAHKVGDVPGVSVGDDSATATSGINVETGGSVTTDLPTTSGTTTTTADPSISATDTMPTTATEAGESSTGAFDPVAACGVDLELDGSGSSWVCECDACEVRRNNLSPASAKAMIAACACICDAAGCGASASGEESGPSTATSTDGGNDSVGTSDGETTIGSSTGG